MSAPSRSPTVKPEVEFAVTLLDQIAEGRLRAPHFQRPFVWRPEQMRDLFDSIEQGYPVGTLLLWDADRPHRSLDVMGVLRLPPSPDGTISYLLDGHQRLSTLYSVLKLPADHAHDPDDDSWKWWIYRNLEVWDGSSDSEGPSASRFEHHRRGSLAATDFPLRASLRTTDFLAYARELEEKLKDEPGAKVAKYIERAEEVATRIKTYKMGLIRVVGGSLQQAVEIFSRLNSKGQKILPDQMVAALTYREDTEGGFSLSERLDEIQNDLERLDYGEVPRDVVFRTILAATGQSDIQRTDWAQLAKNIGDDVPKSIEAARSALTRTIRFLRDRVGIPHARIIPYAAQMVQLAAFFIECPEPTDLQQDILEGWLWSTSFSGWFGGANTTMMKKTIESMRALAHDSLGSNPLLGSRELPLPYPTRFDLQSARVRTLLLWQLRTRSPLDANGAEIDVPRQLALHESRAWRHILRSQVRNTEFQSDPANRILLPPDANKSVRQTVLALDPNEPVHAEILESHFISSEAHRALVEEDYETFLDRRASMLAAGEREFLRNMGLEISERERGEPIIDTDG